MTTALLTFLACGLVLVLAAGGLARSADAIAERTGIGRLWIGAVLMAAATSLPELATDVAAVRHGAPDLAAGDLFGSSMANMLLLALVDLLPPGRGRVLRGATFDTALAACLAIALNATAAALVLTRPAAGVWGIAPGSALLLLGYLAGTRAIYRNGVRSGAAALAAAPAAGPQATAPAEPPALRPALLAFAGAALVILLVAPPFAAAGARLAHLSGLGSTFVGTLLVGLCTSLPELVASITAVRLGAFDLAVGNLFGSNAFNMVIFFAMDLAAPAPIFAALDPAHAVSAAGSVVLMAMGLSAVVYRAERRFHLLEPGSALIVVTYVAAVVLLFFHTRPAA